MARLWSQPGICLGRMILVLVLVQGENSEEVLSTCASPEKVPVGGSAVITFSFFGDFGNKEIAVFKRNAPDKDKISDCYSKGYKRECEVEEGYSFTLMSDKERTLGVLVIERFTNQSAGEYVCQILDSSKLFTTCNLQVSTEKAEVTTPPIFREVDYSDDKEDPTDADQTSGLSPGAVAGIGALVCLGLAAVAVVVFIKYKRREEMGSKSYLQTTMKECVISIEKDVQKCISPDDSRSSDSRPGPASPLMKTKV